jgi:hypothetical protein
MCKRVSDVLVETLQVAGVKPSCDQRLALTPTEVTMVLDEAYDSDLDEASLEHDAVWFDRAPPELEWDDSDISTVVADLISASRMRSYT